MKPLAYLTAGIAASWPLTALHEDTIFVLIGSTVALLLGFIRWRVCGRRKPRVLWVVGKLTGHRWVDTFHGRWEFQGVYDSYAKAEAACRTEKYFVGPAPLNAQLPDVAVEWPNARYPRTEERP